MNFLLVFWGLVLTKSLEVEGQNKMYVVNITYTFANNFIIKLDPSRVFFKST